MTKATEKLTVEIKNNKKWEICRVITDKTEIYESLSKVLIAKKLHGCSYVKRIEDKCNYDGTRTIKITFDDDVRRIYVIEF